MSWLDYEHYPHPPDTHPPPPHHQGPETPTATSGTPARPQPRSRSTTRTGVNPSTITALLADLGLTTRCQPPAVGQFHVPGIDHTLTSLAGSRGDRVVGVLLTGMGRDGAAGLLALRQRGAVTIGQDEATSAVYGMPAAALALGAVEYQLPLAEIAPVLCRLVLGAGSAGRPTAAAATVGSAAVGSAPVGSAPVVVPTNGSGTAR